MRRKALASHAIALLLVGACSFVPVEDDLEAFTQWARNVPVGELEQYLATSNLDGVVPTRQLLRTATDWRKCGGPRLAFAIDVIPRDGKIDEALLCDFWRTDGKAWDTGLSKYPSGRIHLDTSGYRTWGWDQRMGTSFCK